MRWLPVAAALSLMSASACGPHNEIAPVAPVATSPPSAAPVVDDPNAPTPFTADQIRSASHVGRTYEFLIERPDGPAVRKRMVFVAVSNDKVTVESSDLDGNGKPVEAPQKKESSWEELRLHAAYPKGATTIEAANDDTPVGSFACKRYTVIEKTGRGEEKTVAFFANELPGPPVELRHELNGNLEMTMTLLRYDPG